MLLEPEARRNAADNAGSNPAHAGNPPHLIHPQAQAHQQRPEHGQPHDVAQQEQHHHPHPASHGASGQLRAAVKAAQHGRGGTVRVGGAGRFGEQQEHRDWQQQQDRDGPEHALPAQPGAEHQQRPATQDQPYLITGTLDAVARTPFLELQQLYGERIGGDVLRGAQQVDQQQPQQHTQGCSLGVQRSEQACANERQQLQRQQPGLALPRPSGTGAVQAWGPQELECPGQQH